MNKKVFVVLGALALLTAPAYAQRPLKMAKQVTDAMTGGVHSAFSSAAPVSVLNAEMLGNKVARAQFALTNSHYLSSAELFKRVEASKALSQVPARELRELGTKFAQLDGAVVAESQWGYVPALWSMKPATEPTLLGNPQVQAMMDVLNIQLYMKENENEFPQMFQILEGGWLATTHCLSSMEGNRAFMSVLSILVKEQEGQASPAIVEQLALLHANARNQIKTEDVVKQLKNWRAANNSADAPKLPAHMDGISLRHGESLWLATEIRLLQLTPNIELPEILQTAQVVR